MSYTTRSSGSVKITENGDTSEPSFSLSPGVIQQIKYVNPVLDSAVFYPETALAKDVTSIYGSYSYGAGIGTITSSGTTVTGVGTLFLSETFVDGYIESGGQKRKIVSITNDLSLTIDSAFTPDITVGAAYTYGADDVYFENPILGQVQDWRVSFSYTGKSQNAAEGIDIILKNPISGFERLLPIVLSEGTTTGDFLTAQVSTYADANSLQAPLGTGIGGYQLYIRCIKQSINVVIKDIARLNSRY